MTTQHIGFSILSAPLAATDRRALSQAWYSALHLAQAGPAAEARAPKPAQPLSRPPSRHPLPPTVAGRRLALESAAMRKHQNAVRPDGVERRVARSLLGKRIERELLCVGVTTKRATFSVAGSATRVHVTLQQERTGLRLVAVCSPRVRAVVAKALEEARFSLARRGIALGVLVKEL